MLDRDIEDERNKDPVDLSTDEYDGGEDEAELINDATDELADELLRDDFREGIARFETSSQRLRLVKGLGGARAMT